MLFPLGMVQQVSEQVCRIRCVQQIGDQGEFGILGRQVLSGAGDTEPIVRGEQVRSIQLCGYRDALRLRMADSDCYLSSLLAWKPCQGVRNRR